ncbi:MAG: hypothetical protein LBC49_03505 [Bacteroidales bacterium]|jgi:nitrite reductase/ring-hydroxylating ferredoxin subunit|nr:hypothetical protein [Bacteroidales bacterium]
MVKFRNIIILFVCILFIGGSCSRVGRFIKIPVPAVSFNVYPYSIDYVLGPMGNYKIFPLQGYAGIIVYHYTADEFLAFDLACPNDFQNGCSVEYKSSELILQCKCCGTTFSIFDGYPRSNVEAYPSPLHQYNATLIQNDVLYVTN